MVDCMKGVVRNSEGVFDAELIPYEEYFQLLDLPKDQQFITYISSVSHRTAIDIRTREFLCAKTGENQIEEVKQRNTTKRGTKRISCSAVQKALSLEHDMNKHRVVFIMPLKEQNEKFEVFGCCGEEEFLLEDKNKIHILITKIEVDEEQKLWIGLTNMGVFEKKK